MAWTVQYAPGFTGLTGISLVGTLESAGDVAPVSIGTMTEYDNQDGDYYAAVASGLTAGMNKFLLSGDLAGTLWGVVPASGTFRVFETRAEAVSAGITSLARALGVIAGKNADAGALAEIQATPAGATYNNVTDSLEAQSEAIATLPTDLAGQTVVVASPVIVKTSNGLPVAIEIVQGADYRNANSTAITLTMSGTFPAWTGGTPYLDIDCGETLSVAGTMVTATGSTRVMRFDLTATQTATLTDTSNTQDDIIYDEGFFDARVVMSATDVQKPISKAAFISRRPA